MSLNLPPRLCFGLVGLVLVGVLAIGNPCRSCPRAPGEPAPAALQVAGPAVAPEVAAPVGPADRVAAPPAAGVLEPCPLPEYAHDVVAVRHDEHGEPFWVLVDGRMIKHAVDAHAGQPPYVVLPANGDADPGHLTTR